MTRGAVVLATLLLVASGCGAGPAATDPADGVDLDDRGALLEVELPTFEDGASFRLGDVVGGPVVVNFFASWCAPCVREMPDIETVKLEVGDSVTFVGIDVQDSVEAGRELIDATGITWEIARDPDGDLVVAAGVRGMPTTMLLDAEGQVLEHRTGAVDADELRALIAEHFDVGSVESS